MNYFLFFGGIILVVVVLTDVFSTTIAPHGAGIIAKNLSKIVWRGLRFLFLRMGRNFLLNYSGLILVLVLILVWLIFLWAGYLMIFVAFENPVANTTTGEPATITEIVYFIGYSLSTLGYGDFVATLPGLKILSSILSFTGLIMITTIITFLVPVTGGALQKRKLSSFISTLGGSPSQILINGWNGNDFSKLYQQFGTLNNMMLETSQSLMAYPILHFFHTKKRQYALSLNIAALDEALTILLCYVPEEHRLADQDHYPLRRTITSYLKTTRNSYLRKWDSLSPAPQLEEIKDAQIPLVDPKMENACIEKLNERRAILNALVNQDCWTWEDVHEEKFRPELDIL